MSARDYALWQVDGQAMPGWGANLLRAEAVPEPSDVRDAALAQRIYTGVAKGALRFQYLIGHYADRPTKKIDPVVQKILAVGLYQLREMSRVPASAAVDEAVKQTRRFGVGRSSALVNAVLRRAAREPNVALPGEEDPIEHATVALSYPKRLVERLMAQMGARGMIDFCKHGNLEPPVVVRLFPGVGATRLGGEGIEAEPHERAGMAVVRGARRSTLAAWASGGLAQPQDATAAAVAARCGVAAGMRVLDRCCGSGTKTIQLAQLAGPGGSVTAVDPAAARCEALRRMLAALGIKNVRVEQGAMLRKAAAGPFDRALVDVPCSNSGVLARRAEARYTQTAERLASLVRLQDSILDDTAAAIAEGGAIIYSTCSIWPQENEQRVARFLAAHGEFEMESAQMTMPSPMPPGDDARANDRVYQDSGYVAVLRRK